MGSGEGCAAPVHSCERDAEIETPFFDGRFRFASAFDEKRAAFAIDEVQRRAACAVTRHADECGREGALATLTEWGQP